MDVYSARTLLVDCEYSPEAERSYDVMRGGFVWSDEHPPRQRVRFVVHYSKVIAYRASLTLGEPRREFASEWRELKRAVPGWPGFREERIHGRQVVRDLRAVKLREERCVRDLESELDEAGL